MASPILKINPGTGTYGAAGAAASCAAGATAVATLDESAGVRSVVWSVAGTDETTTAASFTLTATGPVGEIVSWTVGAAGTSGILKAVINGGLNLQTGLADAPGTTSTIKWYVATAGGHEVVTVNEKAEAGSSGWTGIVNRAIRSASAAAIRAAVWAKDTDDAAAGTLTAERTFFECPVGVAATLTSAKYTSNATITADNTDNIVVTIRRRDGAGGAPATVIAYTANVASGAPVLNIPKDFGALANTTLTAGQILTVEVAKGGVGRVLFAGALAVQYTVT